MTAIAAGVVAGRAVAAVGAAAIGAGSPREAGAARGVEAGGGGAECEVGFSAPLGESARCIDASSKDIEYSPCRKEMRGGRQDMRGGGLESWEE